MQTSKLDIQGKDYFYDDGKEELYKEEEEKGFSTIEEAAKAFFERYYLFTLETGLTNYGGIKK